MSFAVSGLSSGIDYAQLIDAMVSAERRPVLRLQGKQAGYSDKISAYSTLSSRLAALKAAADDLKSAAKFFAKKADSSDASVADVAVTSSARPGAYSITDITSLAEADQYVHGGVTDKTASINDSGGVRTFVYSYAGGGDVTVDVADGITLEGLVGLINGDASNPGATATIINDGTSYRMVLTGKDTGSSNTVAIGDGTLDGSGGTEDFRGSTAGLYARTRTAGDANFIVDGISVTKSTNTISDVVEGITFTLKKADPLAPPSATLTVAGDTVAMKARVESFVEAYNKVASYIKEQSYYDTEANKGRSLTGESTARSILGGLRGIIGDSVAGLPEGLRSLSQMGITTDYKSGTLSVDGAALEGMLSSDAEGVFALLSDSADGIAVRVSSYAGDATDATDGSIAFRQKGLERLVDGIDTDIERIERRLDKMQEDLTRQFASLESLLGGLNSQGSFLLNQLALWSQ